MNILQFITLDKSNPTPLYAQLADELEKAMEQGLLRHGDFLPAERLICEAFYISPKVVLTAYQKLAEKKMVKRFVGVGTQVNTRPKVEVNFKDILNIETLMPVMIKNVYQFQELNDGQIPIELSNLDVFHQAGLVDRYPVFFRKVYTHPDFFPADQPFKNIIDHAKHRFDTAALQIDSKLIAVNLMALESAYLDVPEGSPGFYFRTVISLQHEVIAFMRTYFSGEYTVWSDNPEVIRF